jgi:hypothetical protein
MVALFRLTSGSPQLAAVLRLDTSGRAEAKLIDDSAEPIIRDWFEDGIWSSSQNRVVEPEDGEAFLAAAIESLQSSSYWTAQPHAATKVPAMLSRLVAAGG